MSDADVTAADLDADLDVQEPQEPQDSQEAPQGAPQEQDPGARLVDEIAVVIGALDLPSGDRLTLYKFDAGGTKGYVGRIPFEPGDPPDQILERIRAKHGPGEYQVTAQNAKGLYVKSRRVTIWPDPEADDGDPPDAVMDAIARLSARLDSLAAQGSGPSSNIAQTIAEQASALASTFISSQQPLLEALIKARGDEDTKAVDMLLRGMELGQDRREGKDTNQYAALFARLLDRIPPGPGNGAAPSAIAAPALPPWAQFLHPYLGPFVGAAGQNAWRVGNALADLLPPVVLDDLLDAYARDPGAVLTVLCNMAPGLQPHRAWLQDVLRVLGDLVGDGEEDDEAEPQADPS